VHHRSAPPVQYLNNGSHGQNLRSTLGQAEPIAPYFFKTGPLYLQQSGPSPDMLFSVSLFAAGTKNKTMVLLNTGAIVGRNGTHYAKSHEVL
jgi:hypothetical protein